MRRTSSDIRTEIDHLTKEYYNAVEKEKKPFVYGDRIGYSGRVYDEKEMVSLVDSALDFWLTTGKYCNEFEKAFSDFLGVRYCHLVNSGSSANLIAFSVLTAAELGERRIKKDDEIITVACGFPTTVSPIIQYGAVPVFIDLTIPKYNVDTDRLEEAYVKGKTKAVFLAHTLGNPFNIEAVRKFCYKYNLWLVEDNCDALGSKYSIDGVTKFTGTWGDIGTSSFYPPHHITMGEGGAVYTDNPLLHKLILSYRDWGRDCWCVSGHDNTCGHRYDGDFGTLPHGYDHKYVYSHLGYNLKVTDMQAAIGVEQLKKLPQFIDARRKNWNRLYNELKSLSDKIILPEAEENSDPSWFGFMITIRPGAVDSQKISISRNDILRFIEGHNIQTRLLFSGNITRQPCFNDMQMNVDYRVCGGLTNSDYIMENSFWIGVYPGMTEDKMDYMISVVKEAFLR